MPDQTTAAGRSDYNASMRFRQIEPGEPVFLVRGRDALSGQTVRAWAALAHRAHVPLAVVEQALQQADAMDEWADKKLPDADHLGQDEVLQLSFEFERRAYRARDDVADMRIALAEDRAFKAAQARLRPALAVLFAGLQKQDDGSYVWRMPTDDRGKAQPWNDPFEDLHALGPLVRGEVAA